MGEGLEIAKVLVSPIEKLIDATKSGAGILYQPKHLRRMTDAKVYEIDQISDVLRKNSDVLVSYNDGSVIANIPEWDEFVNRTRHRLICQELRNQQNIEAVVDNAYSELQNETTVTEEPVDADWIARLFSIVKDVSNEEMQFVWGKILAGEIKHPKSFSFRTLETIRNMSQKEAEIFQRLMPLIVRSSGAMFITSKNDLLIKYGTSYGDIMLLDECGLINSSGTVSLNPEVSNNDEFFLYNNKKIALVKGLSEKNVKISFGIHLLTRAGRELYGILASDVNNDIIEDIAKDIFDHNKNSVEVNIHKVNFIIGEQINYDDIPILHFGKVNKSLVET